MTAPLRLLATVLLGLAGGIALPVATQAAIAAQGTTDRGGGGRTWCAGGAPFSVVSPVLDSATSREVARHEAIHRRQLAPACDSLLALYQRDPGRRLEAEAEAFCGGLGPVPHPGQVARVALTLRSQFPEVGDDSLAHVVGRWCGPALPEE